jgi:hypothetical protein
MKARHSRPTAASSCSSAIRVELQGHRSIRSTFRGVPISGFQRRITGLTRLGHRFCHDVALVPQSRRIDASLTTAKAFGAILKVEGFLQGRIKVDGTFA